MKTIKISMVLMIVSVMVFLIPACGQSQTVTNPTGMVPVPQPGGLSVSIDITAKGFKFDKASITVPAGAAVTINFSNQDAGIPHNVAIYTDSSASKSIFVGQVITGASTTVYKFTAPSTPGKYFFRCDIHPAAMTGDFIVVAAP